MTFTILPAVDIQYGKAVQLVQGVSSSQKVYGDPLDAALRWRERGATWLHLVDLDAAFSRGSNAEVIASIVATSGMNVEVAGGIRDDPTLEAALATGCRRVNIGTAAVTSPEWTRRVIASHGDKIAIALDVAGKRVATNGWVRHQGRLWDIVDQLNEANCQRFVITDTTVDGTLSGPNIALLRDVCAHTSAAVIASGGISSLDDIRALTALESHGLEGAIIGTALYEGTIALADALEIASQTPR